MACLDKKRAEQLQMTEHYEYFVDFFSKMYTFISGLRIGYFYEAKAHTIAISFTKN